MKLRIAHFWFVRLRPLLRRIQARILRLLPISSRDGGVPKGVIWDAAEWIRETERRNPPASGGSGHWQVKVRDSELITLPPPRTIESSIPPVFDSYRRVRYPELSVTCIRRGRVATSEGTVISPDDRVFDQFAHQWGDPVWKNKVFELPGLGRLENRDGRWVTLIVPASGINVGHWLMDGILRLSVLEAAGLAGDAKIIVPDTRPKYTQPVEALGYGPDRYGGLREGHWEVEQLLVPSYLSAPGFIRPWGGRWLRERLGVEEKPPGSRRLWISRNRARYRRLQNEEEILALLSREGFEKVELEGLTFLEQVDILSQANAVAGPHGAGMTNLLFAPHGARVLELFPPEFVNPVFYSMANSQDQEYYYLTGYSLREDRNPEGAKDLDHFRVDPGKIVQSLKLMNLLA
ncbi:MAG: glycosyltransferase family 61 protein [Anaerolineales bacterium]|nr:glycosyltransferase family 61 protein [Anaerolineales bacterium]